MKNIYSFTMAGLFIGSAIFSLMTGCSKKSSTRTYSMYRPVYTDKSSALNALNGSAAQSVDSAGKVYVLGHTIFLNDLNKGIHIFDNTDPRHPLQVAFLSIPGNQDIAIKGNILYADMYQDLLAIDISDPRHAKFTGKIKGLFAERNYVNGYEANTDEHVITSWTRKDTTIVFIPEGRPNGVRPIYPGPPGGPVFFDAAASNFSNTTTGTAGSMAGMVLINDYLYAISERHTLGVVNVAAASSPSLLSTIYAGFDLETIYPFRNQLFLGSAEGVYIYDLSNPAQPVSQGQFTHGTACDPVIADGDFAYVTLHAGSACGGASNELDVVNIQKPAQSQLLRTYPQTKPMGLCKDGNLLFVCDGPFGVKIYNAQDPGNLKLLSVTGGGQAYDVIASNQNMLVVASDGLYQYDYSNPSKATLLSLLPMR
jgi:hypothetical protein